jgi:hypothetical protein
MLLTLNFIMLCSLTWMQEPIQKVINAMDEKIRVKAYYDVCNHVEAIVNVEAAIIEETFITGCAFTMIDAAVKKTTKDPQEQFLERERLIKRYRDKDDSLNDELFNACGDILISYNPKLHANYMVDSIQGLLNCDEVDRKARKMGVSN